MSLFTVHNQISRNDLGRMFAGRQYDAETFGPNFSNLTPNSVDACMDLVFEGKLLPFVIQHRASHQIVAWHYLHDMNGRRHTTWIGGYIMEGEDGARGYGAQATAEKTLLWQHYALPYIKQTYGYPQIFAYVMDVNARGKLWATECCGLTGVGRMLHAVPEDDGWADIEVYTHYPKGEEECRRQAEVMFPEGRWVE